MKRSTVLAADEEHASGVMRLSLLQFVLRGRPMAELGELAAAAASRSGPLVRGMPGAVPDHLAAGLRSPGVEAQPVGPVARTGRGIDAEVLVDRFVLFVLHAVELREQARSHRVLQLGVRVPDPRGAPRIVNYFPRINA